MRTRYGHPFASDNFNGDGNGTPVIRIRDITRQQIQTWAEEAAPRSAWVSDGDLVVGMDGDFNHVLWMGGKAALNQRLCAVDAGPQVDRRFLFYVLAYPLKAINDTVHFTTVKHLSFEELLREQIPVPPLAVQRRIADYLDVEARRIGSLLEMNQSAERTVRERLDALLAMSVGTDVIDRSDGVPVGLRGMANAPLYTLAEVQSGLTLNAASTHPIAPAWPYLRVANVQDGRLDLREVKTVHVPAEVAHRHLLRPGDVLMTEGGDPDKLGRGTVFRGEVEDCLHQNHVFAVRPDERRLSPSYLALVTRTPYARAYFEKTSTKSTGIASTNASKIGAWRVPLPPREVQDQIVARTDAAAALTDEVCRRLLDQRTLLQERRQALITGAVTGQIGV